MNMMRVCALYVYLSPSALFCNLLVLHACLLFCLETAQVSHSLTLSSPILSIHSPSISFLLPHLLFLLILTFLFFYLLFIFLFIFIYFYFYLFLFFCFY